MQPEKKSVVSTKDLKQVFQAFDKDKSGSIELSEIWAVLKELGETIPEQELSKLVKKMDLNGDGKISYSEFDFWWKHGIKGKLKNVVQLQLQAMKELKQVHSKMVETIAKLKGQYTSDMNTVQGSVSLGEEVDNIKLGVDICTEGAQYNEVLSQLRSQGLTLECKEGVTALISFEVANPQDCKKALDDMIAAIWKTPEEGQPPSLFSEIAQISHAQTALSGNKLYLVIEPKGEANPIREPIALAGTVASQFGTASQSSKLSATIRFSGLLADALETKDLIQWVCQGFSVGFSLTTHDKMIDTFRELFASYLKPIESQYFSALLIMVVERAKLDIKLRSPKNALDFLKTVTGMSGITETALSLDFLKDVREYTADWNDPANQFHPIYKAFQFVSGNIMGSKVQLNVILPFGLAQISLKAVGGSTLLNKVFFEKTVPPAAAE